MGSSRFLRFARKRKREFLFWSTTSNPSSGEFQDRLIDGKPLYELVGEKVAEWADSCMGDQYSYVGAVVGATYPEIGNTFRR